MILGNLEGTATGENPPPILQGLIQSPTETELTPTAYMMRIIQLSIIDLFNPIIIVRGG